MLILETRGSPEECPDLECRMSVNWESVGGVDDECIQVGVNPIPVGRLAQNLPEDFEGIRRVSAGPHGGAGSRQRYR